MSNNEHSFKTDDSRLIPYHVARGDKLLQNEVFKPETIRKGLELLSKYGGDLAYTPEMVHRFEEVLERRYNTNDGWDNFGMPNGFGVYENPDMASFYGANTSDTSKILTKEETFQETVDRLVKDTVREINTEMAGLSQQMNHYYNESWARYGIVPEVPFSHEDPDVTLFRNPSHGWSSISIPASTSEKSNVIDMYQGVPEYTFPTPHPGFEVDRRGAFYDRQEPDKNGVAYGF
jgi:hypothetical protein